MSRLRHLSRPFANQARSLKMVSSSSDAIALSTSVCISRSPSLAVLCVNQSQSIRRLQLNALTWPTNSNRRLRLHGVAPARKATLRYWQWSDLVNKWVSDQDSSWLWSSMVKPSISSLWRPPSSLSYSSTDRPMSLITWLSTSAELHLKLPASFTFVMAPSMFASLQILSTECSFQYFMPLWTACPLNSIYPSRRQLLVGFGVVTI